MNPDHMQEMADQCLEMMRTMSMHHGAGDHAGGMGGIGSMMGTGGWLGLLVLSLLIVVGGGLLAVVLTRRRSSDVTAGAGSALDELDRRYARGEVERDSYIQIRDDLRGARG